VKSRPMNKVDIDLDVCIRCKMCVDACFVNVFRWDNTPGDEKPVAAYQEDCVWCLSCEEICPVQCIDVKPTIPGRLPAHY
jgi:NAD-dependent dihydropyrimidine dehydrogenase PreA subunit